MQLVRTIITSEATSRRASGGALVAGVIIAALVAACGSAPVSTATGGTAPPGSASAVEVEPATPSAAASAPAAASPGPWQLAQVPLPSAVTTAPSLQPGFNCHPCHFLAEDQFLGVGTSASGLVAVGVQQPPAQATAYSSTDGTTWTPLAGFDPATTTTAIALASMGARTVMVGLESSGATAWVSDGGTWTQAPRQPDLLVAYAAGGMTSVTPFDGGFVAGGYRDDPLHNKASAAVWRSPDGLTWHLDSVGGVFAGGRIWGMASRGGTIVAVGTNGDPNYGPVGAWRWTQATGWQRARVGPTPGGAMKAVITTSTGFLAVGLNGQDEGAMTWTSPDGATWTAAPDQPSFHFGQLAMRMQSVVAVPAGFLAGGWRSDQAKGSAVTWASADGVHWQPATWEPEFSGGQITGVAVIGGEAVAVGRTGYPDWDQATIWVTAAP